MSAYMVNKKHIDALVTLLYEGPIGIPVCPGNAWYPPRIANQFNPDELGELLSQENSKSLYYRYPDLSAEDAPRPYCFTPGRRLTPVEALKAINGFRYQACEHPTWESSTAFAVLEACQHALISLLPGYDDADTWSID